MFCRPGSDLLSRVLRRSTIGAGAFHGRVRNGIGCLNPAITTRSAKHIKEAGFCFLPGTLSQKSLNFWGTRFSVLTDRTGHCRDLALQTGRIIGCDGPWPCGHFFECPNAFSSSLSGLAPRMRTHSQGQVAVGAYARRRPQGQPREDTKTSSFPKS